MGISGYATTLTAATSGTMAGVQKITAPNNTVDNIKIATLGDTNHIAANLPGGATGGPMTATLAQAIVGYGATIAGVTTLALNTAKSIKIGGGTTAVVNVKTLSDVTRHSNNIPGELTEAAVTLTAVGDKTDEAACQAAYTGQTVEAWTITGSDGSTWVGNGHITAAGGGSVDTTGEYTFNVTIQPSTTWTFTAGTAMAQYATLYTAWKSRTIQVWTATIAGSGYGAYAGAAFISAIGGIDIGTTKEQAFDITLTPSTLFAFTAA